MALPLRFLVIAVVATVTSTVLVVVGAPALWLVATAFAALTAAFLVVVMALHETRRSLVQITARDRRTETTLRETQERFRLIAETVTEIFWMADVAIERMVYISPGYERVFGRTCESLYREPKSFIDAIHPDDKARVLEDYARRKRVSVPFEHEYRIVRRDGSIRWIWDRGFPIHNELGETIHYVGVAQDITERMQIEHGASAQAERFGLVCRATNDGIWDWDIVAGTAWWSETFYATFGVPPGTVSSYEAWVSLVHPDDRARVLASFEQALAEGHETWTEEYRVRHGNGTWCDVLDRAYVTVGSDGKPLRMIGALMDISERRKLENQLHHAQKMDAIGQLAGGVAHDFNNILQAIMIQSRLLQRQGLPATADAIASDVHACAERAAALTRQLMLFSRREVMEFRPVDLNAVVNDLATVLHRTLGEHVAVKLATCDAPAIAHADRGMLDQVLLNLALNARDSMPTGGELSIATTVEPFGQPAIDHVCITVRDTGCGIAPDVMPRIFEPFFTTKKRGDGTGLGLASAFGIVQQHRGTIEVESTLDQGATFRVWLPLGAGHPAPARDVVASQPRGSERILLVEDDDGVRSSTRQLLELQGYDVFEATTGLEALDRFEECGHVDLVLTDVVMPGGIDGGELASRLEARQPNVKIVFTSGYSAVVTGLDLEHRTFVHKPVVPERLLEAVRTCLDRSP